MSISVRGLNFESVMRTLTNVELTIRLSIINFTRRPTIATILSRQNKTDLKTLNKDGYAAKFTFVQVFPKYFSAYLRSV